jgi:hypothetical protein
MFHYDDEMPVGYQDADYEMRELEAMGERIARLEAQGVCTHSHTVGLGADGRPYWPEAEGLTGTQCRCTDCGQVFADTEDWLMAQALVLDC